MTLRHILFFVFLLPMGTFAQSSQELLTEIVYTNDEYQATHSPLCDTSAGNVAYFLGNMEAYRLTGKAAYYAYCDTWCRYNKWNCAEGDTACLAVYAAMNALVPAEYKGKHHTLSATSDASAVGRWLREACQQVREQDKSDATLSFTVVNTSADNRSDVVSIDAQEVYDALHIAGGRQFVIRDSDGEEVPYQLTCDGQLLVQAFVRPRASSTFTICYGQPADYRLDVNGRIYPDREGDLAFENDKNAWRLYGSPMRGQGTGGYDIFTKNVPYPIQDQLYHSELTSYALHEELEQQGRGNEWAEVHRNTYTYHRNHGQGMDAYTVAQSLGAGAAALIRDGSLVLPPVYETAEILDNGPLRFTVRMTLYPQEGITETRRLTIDKGTHLARCEVWYAGLAHPTEVCSGIVLHSPNDNSYTINEEVGYIAYADAMDTPQGQNGELYIACLYPTPMDAYRIIDNDNGGRHLVGQTTYTPDTPFICYCGTAWSRYDVPTMSVWEALLCYYARNIREPLTININ